MSAIVSRAGFRSGGDPAAAAMAASQATKPRQRYRSNPLRPVERPINAPTNASAYSRLTASKPASVTASSAATAAAAASSSPPPAASGAPAVVGGADPTTLPRGKVTDVYRREENGVRKTTIKITLTSGEERSVTDSGVELVTISGEVSTGDSVSLVPTGPAAFQWQREADPTLASAASKQRKRRRVFTVDDLIGEKGVARIVQSFPRMRWRGLGYEADDLHRLMFAYKLWANEMFPHLNFLVLIKAMEGMGATRRVQRYLDAFRFNEREADGSERHSSLAGAAAAAVPAAAVAHEKEERERRLYDEAAAAMLDDVYGDGALQQVEAEAALSGSAAASLPEATDAADAAALQESLRVMGLLPPAAESSAPAASAAVDADARARMEDNRRKAMEKRAAAEARRQEQDQQQQQQSASAAAADAAEAVQSIAPVPGGEPSPHREETAETDESNSGQREAQQPPLPAAGEAQVSADCDALPTEAEAAERELQCLAELVVPETLEADAEAEMEPEPHRATVAAADAAMELDVVPSSLSEAEADS